MLSNETKHARAALNAPISGVAAMRYAFGFAFLLLAYAVIGIAWNFGGHSLQASKSPPPANIKVAYVEASTQKAAETDEVLLIKDIQRALADAQCYDGAIDGVWNEKSVRAIERAIISSQSKLSPSRPQREMLNLIGSSVGIRSACAATPQVADAGVMTDASKDVSVAEQVSSPATFKEQRRPVGGARRARSVERLFLRPLGSFHP